MATPASTPDRLTFIGGGHLAQALIDGIYATKSSWTKGLPIAVTGRRLEHVAELKEKYPNAVVTINNRDPAIWDRAGLSRSGSHVLFICPLPVDVPPVCLEIASTLESLDVAARPTVVTLCPGISVAQLQSWLPKGIPIIRSMPNLPVTCREGATGLFPSRDALSRIELVATVLREVSPAVCVVPEEPLLDVVAAISGSAPAHFYFLIEALTSAAEAHGLAPEVARQLVVQSCVGSGMLSRDAKRPISALREEVCVPGGSTEKAIAHLASNEYPKLLQDAVGKSLQANREMSRVDRT